MFFSGIGGTGIGPLAQIAKQAGYEVSGSDKQDSRYIKYLKNHGLGDIHIGQTKDQLSKVHMQNQIDWYVYSSAVAIEQPDSEEIKFCKENNIKISKRDEFLNHLITEKNLKLIAVAGTHGKTTVAAMAAWLFKQLDLPISYSVGAKISFGDMGEFNPSSSYFILEADEFDKNFLAFHSYLAVISGVDWDHHEIYPTRDDYKQAFLEFLSNSQHAAIWKKDGEYLGVPASDKVLVLSDKVDGITLPGPVNRQNAYLVMKTFKHFNITDKEIPELAEIMNNFPGVSRRFERITNNLFSDYAHTTEKIKGCLDTAFEMSKNVVIVYEPLTNRRQHFIKDDYHHLFEGVKRLYWVPSYLAREDPKQKVLSPTELIKEMANKDAAEPAELNDDLADKINRHLVKGDLVVAISGGGGASLDEWLRKMFAK